MTPAEYHAFVLGIIVGTLIVAPLLSFVVAAAAVRLLRQQWQSRTNIVRFPRAVDHKPGSKGGS